MANDPAGDIEILSPAPSSRKQDTTRENNPPSSSSQLRIRHLRRSRTVEISSYFGLKDADTGVSGEWKRKVLRVVDDNTDELRFFEADTVTLKQADWDGLALLGNFIPVCSTLANWGTTTCLQKKNPTPLAERRQPLQQPVRDTSATTSAIPLTSRPSTRNASNVSALATASTAVLSQLDVIPRPAKLSLSPGISPAVLDDPRQDRNNSKSSVCASQTPIMTKFLPTVGWCTHRQSACDASEYRILFLDGASLAVNIGSGSVELTTPDGTVERYVPRETFQCHHC